MDKGNKNRTDLLAAGRKKLQQFRQKKDGKGGKSLSKPNKSEGDSVKAGATSEQVVDGDVPEHNAGDVVASSELDSGMDSATVGYDVGTVEQSSKVGAVESSSIMSVQKLPLEDSGVNDTTLDLEVDNKHDDITILHEGEDSTGFHKGVEYANLETSEVTISKEKFLHSDMPLPAELVSQVERPILEEQVTDDFGSSVPKQAATRSEIGIERVVTNDRNLEVKEATSEAAKITDSDYGSSSTVITGYADVARDMGALGSVSSQPSLESKEFVAITAQIAAEEINSASGSSNEGQVDSNEEKGDREGSSSDKVDVSTSSPGSRRLTLSSGSDSISLSQLADMIKNLDEGELKFLLDSREAQIETLPNTLSFSAPQSDIFDVCERLKDHLYLTSFAEHTFQLQLAEELEFEMLLQERVRKLVEELSLASASLEEVQGNNEFLSEDLTQCRSQLWEVVSGRDALNKQLHDSKAEVEVFSSKVNDLEKKLEMSPGNLAALSSELADCRNLAAALHTENENLNAKLSLVTKEKMKLAEEREYFVRMHNKIAAESADYEASLASLQLENVNLSENLALLREERMQFYEEKEHLVHGNTKLLSQLADLKGMVEALQAESTNSNGVLKAVEEEKKKLEEAKEYFVHENEKLATDLMKNSSLVEALQTDISNINGSLALLTEERNKLHEEKENLLTDSKSQLHELAETKVLMAGQQAEFSRAVADLREASLWIEQLSEENVFLRTSLEWHMAEMSRSVDITHQAQELGDRNLINNNGSSLIPRSVESETAIRMSEKISTESHAFRPLSGQHQLSDLIDLSELEFWERHVEEANEVLQRLENTIEELHSQLASSNTPSSKAVSAGVSKLIHAFESKGHTDDHETAELSPDNLNTQDLYMQTKMYTEHLKVFLSKLFLHAENTSKLIEGERQSKVFAEVKGAELMVCYESLKDESDHLEGKNIELMVLFEALRQHICISEARLGELVLLYEASQKQGCSLNVENSQLRERLHLFHAKISEFESQLDEICQNWDKMFSSLSNSMEALYKEVGERDERGSILEGEWNSFVENIVQAVGKLDASIENLCSFGSSAGFNNSLEVGAHIIASIDAAIRVIQAQQGHLKATEKDREDILSTYMELNKEFNNLREKNEMAIGILDKIYKNLRKVAGSHGYAGGNEAGLDNKNLMDPLDSGVVDVILQQLENLVEEKMELQSFNNKLNSDLMDRVREIDELNRTCLDADTVLKFFEDAQQAFKLDSLNTLTDEPLLHLKSLINAVIQKYNEAEEQISLSMKTLASNEMHCRDLQEEVNHLSFLHAQFEVENVVLKDSWKTVNEDILPLRTELLEKVAELEQSEQRVSSLREKLSIAVTKGKGLVVQRDGLKQSLAETSSQLEKYLQELQSKDVRIHELEAKIKNYSEAGERMEALESELSYIRNSATALRESFLLKDSVLQRIEEILEDLELPEQFHTGGIIEKVDWLAKTVNGNTLPLPEWDQKITIPAGSYSDSGYVDSWKEETQPNQNSVDEFRRRYEELQSKFFALAEQNEMLEQSLMERNNLVQRWEDTLGRVDMPLQLRLSEPEDRIEWLGTALSESEDRCNALQQRIDYLDTHCGSLSHDLKKSQSRISELESVFQSAIVEKELLLTNLEIVNHQYDEASQKLVQWESRNEVFLKEICSLQEKLDQKLADVNRLNNFEVEVRRLQDLIRDVLQDSCIDDLDFASDSIKTFEKLLKILIEKYMALLLGGNPVNLDATDVNIREEVGLKFSEERIGDSRDTEEENVLALSKRLENMLGELMHLKEERDKYKEDNQSLVREIEAFDIKNNELQQLLNQEENKSASLREKLNIAVKKGKSLVQQRDRMKQVIDEVNTEVERLKYEISLRENAIAEYEQKIRNLSTRQERLETTESECGLLRDRLEETEHRLHEKENLLSVILNSLKDIDLDVDFKLGTSLENVEAISKRCHDLCAALDSSQQESRKSKRAAELLLAELNEVQERNDGLQEELANVAAELSQISREKELSEAAKSEALAQLEKLSALRSEERDHHLAEVTMLRSSVELLRDDLSVVDNLMADVLSKGLEILHNLEASIKSCMEPTKAPHIASLLAPGAPGGITCPKSENKVFMAEIGSIKERLSRHYTMLYEEASHMSEAVRTIYRDVASLKQVSEARESDLVQLDTIVKEKDSQLFIAHRNISLLYEACTVSIMEIENWKAHQAENGLATEAQLINFKSHAYVDAANSWSRETHMLLESSTSEDDARTMREYLFSVVKDLINMQNEIVEYSRKEMKTVIMNLQKELHEKDIQRDKISTELVNKIKEAEAAARNYFQDLQSAKSMAVHLQSQIIVMQEERTALANRVKKLEDRETTFIDLEQRVASLTDALAAKEQETEALMLALDEEESQMEEMSNKVGELENSLQQKARDLENLEASRVKVVKKLSITVSKFDELHQLSESLLSEVEKLQSQLQERDGEISFLRQEVTRCTNEALTATQISNKSDESHEFLTWLDMMVSRVRMHDMRFEDTEINQVNERKQLLQKQVTSIISELEELRLAAQNTDLLLQLELGRVEELTRKEEFLENSLREKESQLILFKRVADSGQATSTASEIVEVEPGINKRAASGTVAPLVRSGRKTNSDQVAIAVDMDPSNRIEDDDDDKAHGFKSLTTSRIIPRFTRPVTDMIDGLWVSCDRALMRQPALRLGLIIYWAILHALLATFVV